MYQNIFYDKYNKNIYLWDDVDGYSKFPYERYAYVADDDGEHTSLYGDKLIKITQWDKSDENYLFESDIRPELRVLLDKYHTMDDTPSTNHRVLFFDIETRSIGGYARPQNPYQPITSISYYYDGFEYCLLLDKYSKLKSKKDDNIILRVFSTERDMLDAFVSEWIRINPTIVTHWNGDNYDIPYLINRLERVFDKYKAYSLSPVGLVVFDAYKLRYNIAGISSLDYMLLYKNFTYSEKPSYSLDAISNIEIGRGKVKYDGSLDDLYQSNPVKFIEYNMEDVRLIVDMDKKLGYIALAQTISHTCHVPYEWIYTSTKLMDGASLTYLKRHNIVSPNANNPIELKISHLHYKGDKTLTVDYIDKYQVPINGELTIKKTETSRFRIKYTHFENNIFYLKNPLDQNILITYQAKVTIPGAYVQHPKIGIIKWLYDLDLRSEYPMNMITLNISPETLVGAIYDWDVFEYMSKADRVYKISLNGKSSEFEMTQIQLNDYLTTNVYYVAANGAIYDGKKEGFIPAILQMWYDLRSKFKDDMKSYKKQGNMGKAAAYFNRQLTQKILLNSFYGVLIVDTFRFANKTNAIAVTSTGQQLIKFCAKAANVYYKDIIKIKDDNYVNYTDTDSVFLSALPLILNNNPNIDLDDDKLMISETIRYAKNVENFINSSFSKYSEKYHHILTGQNSFYIKQENVARTAFFITKKRYGQCILSEEGVTMDESNTKEIDRIYDKQGKFLGKLEVKGINIVRSDFPQSFKIILRKILKMILAEYPKTDVDDTIIQFKEDLKQLEISELLFPTGVNNISKYDIDREPFTVNSRTPIHVKSAMFHNDYMDKYNLTDVNRISDGTKIKWCYLKDNPLNITNIAIRGDGKSPSQLIDFIEKYIDRHQMFVSKLEKLLISFYTSLQWGEKLPTKYNKIFKTKFKF